MLGLVDLKLTQHNNTLVYLSVVIFPLYFGLNSGLKIYITFSDIHYTIFIQKSI